MPAPNTSEDGHDAHGAANGAGSAPPAGPAADGATKAPPLQRAEELTDRLGERVSHYAALLGHKIMQFAARLREEAEDIWEEARSIRRGERPPEA